jgi:hypothetical protein
LDRRRPPQESAPQDDEAPPVTQEENGVGDLNSEEEEFDEDDDDDEELDAACDKATRESISALPRGAKRDGVAAHDKAKHESIPACPCGAKRDDEAELNDEAELDDALGNGIRYEGNEVRYEDDGGREDKGKTAPVLCAGNLPRPQVATALFGSTKVVGSEKTQGKTGQG